MHGLPDSRETVSDRLRVAQVLPSLDRGGAHEVAGSSLQGSSLVPGSEYVCLGLCLYQGCAGKEKIPQKGAEVMGNGAGCVATAAG